MTGGRAGVSSLIAAVAPFAVAAVFLLVTRSVGFGLDEAAVDWLITAAAVGAGLIGIHGLTEGSKYRIPAVLLYIPTMTAGLFFFSLLFVCGVFGNCL